MTSVLVETQIQKQPALILRLKSEEKIYKRGEYMTNEEKRDWYISHHHLHTGWKNNSYALMPDGTYFWILSDKDMYDELLRADGGGD